MAVALLGALLVALLAALLAACAAGPDYVRPALELPAAYAEGSPASPSPESAGGPAAQGWKPADPQAADSRRPWWTIYRDPTLDALMDEALRANADLRVAEAQYRQARALADQARAGYWPQVEAQAAATRARAVTPRPAVATLYSAGLAASWEPDLWGGVRRSVEAGAASAQAGADDLAAARLSIEAALAQDYLQLRVTDRLRGLYAATAAAYARALALTQAQQAAGVALKSDVALARSQLATAQAQAVDLELARAQLEHAIAVLTGRAPAQFHLAAADDARPWEPVVPAPPAQLPSGLLEHRPDIAAAERRAAAANAQIGVARAAFFPTVSLGASGGGTGARLADLLATPERVWSLGAALAATLVDGGQRRARDAQARAAFDAAAAQYKQTVLAGLQQVEDQLAALRLLAREAVLQDEAVDAARLAESLALAQYRAGTGSYLGVVTAQALSLGSQRAAVQLRGRQLAASVSLVAATGAGWSAGSGDPVSSEDSPP